jgi:hypothetical protein
MDVAPRLLRRGLGSLATAGDADAVRLDFLVDAVALSTHDATIGLWRAVVVAATAANDQTEHVESVTVGLADLCDALPCDRTSAVTVTAGVDGIELGERHVAPVDERPAPPQSADLADVELALPESGPAVIDVRSETRLVLDPELVEAFRAAQPTSAKAFMSHDRWFVVASTGPDLAHDPLLVAEAASFAIGTE